jgi:predicted DNA-binding transcriptional regulator AlpA
MDKLFAEHEVASLLRVDRATLRRWREKGTGPKFLRIGPKLIRYRQDALTSFLDGQQAGSAPELKPAA